MKIIKRLNLKILPILSGLLFWILIYNNLLTGSILFVAQLLLFASVIFIIWEGSDLLVNSAQELANYFQVPQILIGLTIVAFGTSVPELTTSLLAGFQGKGDIAVANIIGSNILNISIILGGLAFLTKGGLEIKKQTIFLDAPLILLGTLLLIIFMGQTYFQQDFLLSLTNINFLNLKLDFIEGLSFIILFGLYLYLIISRRKKGNADTGNIIGQSHSTETKLSVLVLKIMGGLIAVIAGCHVLVGIAVQVNGNIHGYGAVWFATFFGIPDFLIGLSIVALGTSIPEIVVSFASIKSKAVDIGIGNLLGSAIFNIFAVIGLAGVFIQPPIADSIKISIGTFYSLLAMFMLFILLTIFLATSQKLSRKEGFILLTVGLTYMIFEMLTYLP